ncbi:MAG: BT_3987 domain-containing protein [Candidatus Cryptobacteroides sp.]
MKKILLLTLVLSSVVSGCSRFDQNKHYFGNKLFIESSDDVKELILKDGIDSYGQHLRVMMAIPEEKDITAVLAADFSKVQAFSLQYGKDNVESLPEKCFTLENSESEIKAGSVEGTYVTLSFHNLETLDRDKEYCLPVTLVSADGNAILRSGETKFYYFREGSLIDTAMDLTGFCCWPEWGGFEDVKDLEQFTMEAMVNIKSFGRDISTLMGIEDKFLLRFGDNGLDPDQLQISSSKKTTSSSLKLRKSRWYHIAVTFDKGDVHAYLNGNPVELETKNVGASKVNFQVDHSDEMGGKPRCFWIGYSYDKQRGLDALISEVRFWNKVLDGETIRQKNHFYMVDPDSEGLVAYWKFNEGTGRVIKDWSPFGNDLTITKTSGDKAEPEWVSVSLSEKE